MTDMEKPEGGRTENFGAGDSRAEGVRTENIGAEAGRTGSGQMENIGAEACGTGSGQPEGSTTEVLPGGFAYARAADVGIPRRQLLWYLGCRGQDPGPAVDRKIAQVCGELEKNADPALFYLRYPLERDPRGYPVIAGVRIPSENLRKNLAGCGSVLLLAATLGAATDRLLYRYGQTDVAGQAVLQAASAALLEAFLDREQDRARAQAAKEGLYLRPRFSPGYGDFALESQRWIFDLLKPDKRLGITLTSGLLMIPSKSVTALAGLSGKDIGCRKNGCEECALKACAFRRE